jgi:hypothetical protein
MTPSASSVTPCTAFCAQVVALGALGSEASAVGLEPLCRMLVSGRWLPSRWVAVAPGAQPKHSHGPRGPRARSVGRGEERTKDLERPASESVSTRVLPSLRLTGRQ